VFDAFDIAFAMRGCRRQILETLNQRGSAVSDAELATMLRLPRKTVSADLAQLAEGIRATGPYSEYNGTSRDDHRVRRVDARCP
jgi:hypothetical protein